MNYNATMTELAAAIRAKSGVEGKLTVPQMIEAVNGIAGGVDYYQCTSVDRNSKTWSGRKASKNKDSGLWFFEENETHNLRFYSITPVVGGIYTDIADVKIEFVNTGFPNDYVFYNELSSAAGWRFSGASIVDDDNRQVFQTAGGSDYAVMENEPAGLPLASSPRTTSHWFKKTRDNYEAWCGIGYGTSGGDSRYTWGVRYNYSIFTFWADDFFQEDSGLINDNDWHNFITTYDGRDIVTHYIDGQKVWEWSTGTTNTRWQYIHVGDPWEGYACHGRFADFYIFDRVLRSDEIATVSSTRTV